MRYRLSEIAAITGGTLVGDDRVVREVITDSRGSVGCDSLFVAIEGCNHDSHRYIGQMVERGVRAFLVEHIDKEWCNNPDISYVKLEGRSIPSLQKIAAHHRKSFGGTVVAITGSNGKTIVKEWIAQLCPKGVKLFRSPRSYNSQLGVALSLLMIEGDEDIAIIEAGISRVGEMERLERMISPDIVVVTSIGEAHQEGFESMEQKIEEKMKLARGAKKVIYSSAYTELIPNVIYGEWLSIDAANYEGGALSDEASQHNSQIVEATLRTLGYPRPNFERLTPIAMRLEMIEGLSDSLIINDSYNSDINALSIALDSLRSNAAGRATTVILSDILQSGVESCELYERVSQALSRCGVDRLIGIGSEITRMAKCFGCESSFFPTTEELLNNITTEDYANRAILLKGNRESRFEKIGHRLARKSHITTLEVNLDAMISNLNYFRSHLAHGVKLTAMVKASSYGAGEEEVAQMLQLQGVDYLAVAFADEGSRLRERGITMPIIVLNADDGSFSQMVDSRLEPEIYSLRSLHDFAAAVEARGEREYPIHIKFDTGMHRLGFMDGEVEKLSSHLKGVEGVVRVSSIFSHLATSDMGDEGRESTLSQIELFDKMSRELQERLNYNVIRHIANSAAITAYPEAHFDMCRLGIGLYGFSANEQEQKALRAVSTLKSKIVQIREIGEGEAVGYGGTGIAKRPTKIATIPIGYADGLDRHLGGGAWSFVVGGKLAPIIGRICMDSCMVDISSIGSVEEGDEVVIFSDMEGNRADDMAKILGTISYEVLTSISGRVKRIYTKE
ncbi:MAG: alanine racemase [Rikenellaceae bacterium]